MGKVAPKGMEGSLLVAEVGATAGVGATQAVMVRTRPEAAGQEAGHPVLKECHQSWVKKTRPLLIRAVRRDANVVVDSSSRLVAACATAARDSLASTVTCTLVDGVRRAGSSEA